MPRSRRFRSAARQAGGVARFRLLVGGIALFAGTSMAGCGTIADADSPGVAGPSANRSSDATAMDGPVLPVGWRWESFAGAQVGVPGDWGWTNSSQRIGQWCVDEGRQTPLEPAVGRPGGSTLVGCSAFDKAVPQEMLVRNTGEIVAFEPDFAGAPEMKDAGDRLTVRTAGLSVIIQSRDEALRKRIAATVHQVDVDANGCPADDPVAQHPGQRPTPVIDLEDATARDGVAWVSACKYVISHPDHPLELPPLLGSRRFDGVAARDLLATLVAAAPGSGPNAPESCMREYSYGDELTVLLIHLDQPGQALQRVHVRYTGCDHHGTDDGTTRRILTRDFVQPLLGEGLGLPWGYSAEVDPILRP